MLIEKFHIFAAVIKGKVTEIPEKLLGEGRIRQKVGKGHLQLYHPEFGHMPGGIGIFSPEHRPEGIDVGKCLGKRRPDSEDCPFVPNTIYPGFFMRTKLPLEGYFSFPNLNSIKHIHYIKEVPFQGI